MDKDLLEDNSSSAGVSSLPKIMGFFPLLRTIRGIAFSHILPKFEAFFYLGPQPIILTLQVFSSSL